MSPTIKALVSVSAAAVLLYALICAIVYLRQTGMIHIPSSQIYLTPSDIGLEYEDVWVDTKDSKLHGWFIPHPDAKFTVLLFHGNAGNISSLPETYKTLHELKLSILIYDYRSYGLSSGKLTENGMYRDAEAMWNYLTDIRKIRPEEIILFGRSLGTAIASWVAANKRPAGLVFESGFSSMADMARIHHRLLPTDLLLNWHYDSLSRIGEVKAPVLFIHSEEDKLTPIELSRKVYAATKSKKSFLLIEGPHDDGFQKSHHIYFGGLKDFVETL